MPKVFCIEWEEPDEIVGSSGDGYSLHLTREQAERFIDGFGASKPDLNYSHFGVPTSEPYLVEVPEDLYEEVRQSPCGIRRYQPKIAPFKTVR